MGAQQPRRERAQRAGGLVAAAAAAAHRAGRGRAASTQGWISEGFASDAQSARYRDWASAAGGGYAAGLDPADEPVGVERTVATRTDMIAVSGRIDRLDARPRADGERHRARRGRLQDRPPRAVASTTRAARSRWRSTRSPPPGRCAATAAGWSCTTCRPGRCSPGSTPTESLRRHLRRAEDVADRVRRRRRADARPAARGEVRRGVPAADRPGCGWCDYLRHCPEGQAAAASHRPWDALAEL